MKTIRLFFLIFLFCFEISAWAQGPRTPIPYEHPYQDGYVFILWGDHHTIETRRALLQRIWETGSRHVSIPLFGCQTDLHSDDVGACTKTNRAFTKETAQLALSMGFSVAYLPILTTRSWEWRGFIEPTHVDRWFESYGRWIENIAQESQALGLSELIVASEIQKLYGHTPEWQRLLRHLRSIFHGPLVMTVNHGSLGEQGFWEDVDAIGLSAYFPLSPADHPTQEELTHAWLRIRDEQTAWARRLGRPLHITEVGYESREGAARTPWSAEGSRPDWQLQARCFEAFRRAWQGEKLLVRAGIWATGPQNPAGYPFDFETIGKPAEEILKRFFWLRDLHFTNEGRPPRPVGVYGP